MDAKCPECQKVAVLDANVTRVKCPHCGFEAEYDDYIEIMKEQAINMSSDYIPDRPGI
ncbi:MAG: zinc-domain-containing protein [Nitrosopumilus sp. H8]|nr:MAG: zinc-domain-containing protein [Nitrosopumilus sp. H13]RNJ78155.1 MAG: zinc-domain-containing protein [Nitrosopumilus sp. H8]